MRKEVWLCAALSLVFASEPRTSPPDQFSSHLTTHLTLELGNIRLDPSRPEEGPYAARRALDLLVLNRIQNPSQWPSVLTKSETVEKLRGYLDALPRDSEPTNAGTVAALLGEYDDAARWYTKPEAPGGLSCGNAAAAIDFGKAEFLVYLDFLRGRYREVTQAAIIMSKPNGILSVDVRSDRWCILYAIAARAFEELGDDITARDFACQALAQSEALDSSWNYYYPDDEAMLTEIGNVVQSQTARLATRCGE